MGFGSDEWVELEGYFEQRTAKAILFNGVNMDEPVWIPVSQMEILEAADPESGLTLIRVKEWIAKKNGWE